MYCHNHQEGDLAVWYNHGGCSPQSFVWPSLSPFGGAIGSMRDELTPRSLSNRYVALYYRVPYELWTEDHASGELFRERERSAENRAGADAIDMLQCNLGHNEEPK